ncbi:tetraprenyl-beta-curcumene synthase family protein [Alkalibacillus sp. S2W]|uniref:tetraprenyl-beta-curcumene synthase family protein n=1 Tax=Alkalibacillus sp. S2W TaxID=3386553 RepID=UPI00398D1EFA
MKTPTSLWQVLNVSYRNLFPEVNRQLAYWRKKAESIPNEELRTQALASIEAKTFHCEGGSIYASLAGGSWRDAVRFIVAYQTISDYLDNLCDRSLSLDPEDFRQLHEAQLDAIRFNSDYDKKNYYQYREDQDDDGYLKDLIAECQTVITQINHYNVIQSDIERLASLYVDLQVHKHVTHEERVSRLTMWYENENADPDLSWYEFSAATGSTLGVFCIVSYGLAGQNRAHMMREALFPSMQGLHILLDYLIDQREDEVEGDLNFVWYYQDEHERHNRLKQFIQNAKKDLHGIPDQTFHQLIVDGLVGLYLSDHKMLETKEQKEVAKSLLSEAGWRAKVVYFNGRTYRRFKKLRKINS